MVTSKTENPASRQAMIVKKITKPGKPPRAAPAGGTNRPYNPGTTNQNPREVQRKKKVTLLAQAPMTPVVTQWRELAACRDSDPNLFFPVGTTGPAIDQIEEAKAVCRACIVREDCLQFSLQTNQEAGVWGGYAEDERRRLRKRWLAERRRAAS